MNIVKWQQAIRKTNTVITTVVAVDTSVIVCNFLFQNVRQFLEDVILMLVAGDLLLILVMCILKLLYYWMDDVKRAGIHRIVASMGDKIEKE